MEPAASQELRRIQERLFRIVVETEHHVRNQNDLLLLDLADLLRVFLYAVAFLSDLDQAVLVRALQPHTQLCATALGCEVQQLLIIRDIQGTLRTPLDIEGDELPEQLLCVLPVGDEVVVHEENLSLLHVVNDCPDIS